MANVVLSGTGLYVPPKKITNEEMVTAFNAYVDTYNAENADAIAAGDMPAKQHSSAEFITKASGIKSRHMFETDGVCDPAVMGQINSDALHGDAENPSIQAFMAIEAAKQALDAAGVAAKDIDLVICGTAVLQRPFPAISIEVQHHLGTSGTALDSVMACSCATFAIIHGVNAIKAGMAKRVLMVNPEIFSSMVNFRDRDSHFIFGDIATAVVLEREDLATSDDQWRIDDVKSETYFSNNIRSNFGPLTREKTGREIDKYIHFVQEGRKVFKELLPLVTDFIGRQMVENSIDITALDRMWLHQANINMNMYAAKKLLGREPQPHEAPTVLDTYGNTAGAGSIVSFHKNRDDLQSGSQGLICSFGAGYSIGSLLVTKL